MKLVFFSDTHGMHEDVQLPLGDILVFCGDMCRRSKLEDVSDFSNYIKKQSHKYKIVIAGNHDFPFENEDKIRAEKLITDSGAIYLNDSGTSIEGISFWGSPVQPEFMSWAFNRSRGDDIKRHWEKIPHNTDVLVTHGPPCGILDKLRPSGINVGCEDLLEKVLEVMPAIHAFGHIHEGYGVKKKGHTIFVNACNLDERYQCVNNAIELEIWPKCGKTIPE
ncbi:MAG: metallophosphatase domain-containing protein [Bacteriovoracaceae bacterium]|nr:metallophosphatase domain-containing protein [Bacteriovoracaceae bacterium]